MATKRTTFSESNISTTNNTSSLTINIYFSADNTQTWFASATLTCTCNGSTQSKNVSLSAGGSVSTSFTFNNIAHNSDGTKSVSWSWRCPTDTYILGTVSDSGTKQLTTIKRIATTTSATDFTDITNPVVTFTNPAGFKIRPYFNLWTATSGGTQIGTTTYPTEIPSTGTNLTSPYTWSLTEAQRNTIRDWFGTRTSGGASVGVDTYNGNTWIGSSSKVVTFTNEVIPPTFTDFTYQDINSDTIAITGDNTKIVLGYSTLQITISGNNKAIANKGATMSYYLINNTQYNYSDSVVVTLQNWNSNTIEITAVDSRGISTKVTKTLTIANYTPLEKGSSQVSRIGNISEETELEYNGTIQKQLPNGNNNTITASYKYKKTTDSTYTTGTTNITPTIDNEGNFSFSNYIVGDIATGFDIDESYNIVIEVSDVLSAIEYQLTLNSGIPAIAIKGNNIAIHGEYDDSLGGTQFNGPVYFDGRPLNFADIVIETGTQSGWNYIKWLSGKVELFGSTQNTGLKLTTASAGTYYGTGTDGTRSVTLPFTFDTILYVNYREITSRSSGIYIYDASVSGNTLSTQFRAHASANNVACGCMYHIIGIVS